MIAKLFAVILFATLVSAQDDEPTTFQVLRRYVAEKVENGLFCMDFMAKNHCPCICLTSTCGGVASHLFAAYYLPPTVCYVPAESCFCVCLSGCAFAVAAMDVQRIPMMD